MCQKRSKLLFLLTVLHDAVKTKSGWVPKHKTMTSLHKVVWVSGSRKQLLFNKDHFTG